MLNEYPEQIAWHISLVVVLLSPPPFPLLFVSLAHHCHGISIFEAEFVGILGLIVIDGIDLTAVQYSELFLDSYNRTERKRSHNNKDRVDSWKPWVIKIDSRIRPQTHVP